MRKITVILLLGLIFFTGCNSQNNETKRYNKEEFTDISWEYNEENDTETLILTSKGDFHYSCGCGNPVNDSDLCEKYTYNKKTNTIELHCIETTDETITNIKIISITKDTLELDFNGKIKTFKKTDN